MDRINTGGPAYPNHLVHQMGPGGQPLEPSMGMTLRAYIATNALLGMLSHATQYRPINAGTDWHTAISEEAVDVADALIVALEDKRSSKNIAQNAPKVCDVCGADMQPGCPNGHFLSESI